MDFLAAEARVFGTPKDLTAQMRTDTAVRVGDGELERLDRRGIASADSAREFVVKAFAFDEHALGLRGGAGDGREEVRESFGGFLVARLQHIRCADDLAQRARAELAEAFANFGGDAAKIGHSHFRFAGETRAIFFVLGGDARQAGVQVALAGHDAADGEKRGGAEAELIGAEESGDDDVAAEFEAAVGAQAYAAAKAGEQKRFVRFAQANFPGQAGIFDRSERRRAGADLEARDGDDVRAGFRDSGGGDSDTRAGDEFHADARGGIDGAQIVNELGQIFDAVNVVVRRRRNQGHAGDGVAYASDEGCDFQGGKLAAFAGFRTLRHFDFEFVGANEIFRGDAEARGGNLFHAVARFGLEAVHIGVFAALAGVAASAEAIHGDRKSADGFGAERAERHGLGAEALQNRGVGLDFIERNRRFAGSDGDQVADSHGLARFGEFGEDAVGLGCGRLNVFVHAAHKLRRTGMLLAGLGETVEARVAHFGRFGRERRGVTVEGVAQNAGEVFAAEGSVSVFEERVEDVVVESHRFEKVTVSIAADGGDAHARDNFAQAGFDSRAVARGAPRF